MDPYNNFYDFCKLVFPDMKNQYEPFPYFVYGQISTTTTTNPFADCVQSAPCKPAPNTNLNFLKNKPKSKVGCEKQEVENTMTTQNTERTYLVNRLRDVNYGHSDTLVTTFKPYDSAAPKTYKELIDAIKNGAYTLDAKKTKRIDDIVADDGRYYGSPWDGIIWNGGPDLKGYHAAQELLSKAYQDAMDITQTGDAATGLKALKDFEAWVAPTPATTAAPTATA